MFVKYGVMMLVLLVNPVWVLGASYEIDPSHTHIGFSIKHLVISNVKGKFNTFSGTIEVDEKDNIKDVHFEIDAASIDTGHKKRDKHLRGSDFLGVVQFPKISFQFKKTLVREGSHYKITGDLSLHGVTKEIILDMELLGKVKDPWGNHRAGMTGSLKVKRKDFGIVWNKLLESGGLVVGDIVKIDLEVEAILKK